jgi:hypothetical protein
VLDEMRMRAVKMIFAAKASNDFFTEELRAYPKTALNRYSRSS